MTNSIPASQLVSVLPSVLGAGGSPIALNSVWLDNTGDTSIPIGTVQPFANLLAVQNWYGAGSAQAALAAIYFAGFIGCSQLPNVLYFAQYNTAAVAAYLRGGSVGGLTLAQLQAINGTINITVNGTATGNVTVNLAAATSFSNAATIVNTALTGASVTSVTCSYDALRTAFVFTSSTTGSASTIGYSTGTASAALYLTAATGAVTSQGAVAAVPATLMNNVINVTQNWCTFMTLAEPTLTNKLAFAAWVNSQTSLQYMYVCFDSDSTALSANATGSFGYLTSSYNGVMPVWNPSGQVAAFICGTTASINFNQRNGRITYAYKGQAGLPADITNATQALNLVANGYNFYGTWATASQQFTNLYPGMISGKWAFADAYVNQVSLNSGFQNALMNLLTNSKSIPYNNPGYTQIASALNAPIQAALTFGSIQAGVPLSAAQAAAVNAAANATVAPTLNQVGWYLQVLPANAQTRGQRQSPPINFWYTDGGSIQQISMASIDAQ